MTGGRTDPRPARSRARLLDAATALLRSGGPSAVTVDAVTRAANVARATLYRHFSERQRPVGRRLSRSLIPPPPMPPEDGSLRDRLTAIVVGVGRSIAEAPIDPDRDVVAVAGRRTSDSCRRTRIAATPDSPEVRSLRERVAEQYAAPFDAIFDSPQAVAELGDVDRAEAVALLLGPLAFGQAQHAAPTSTIARCAVAAVDGFLPTLRARSPAGLTAASTESAGA